MNLTAPYTEDKLKVIKAGEWVYLSGDIYTARDEAHKRLVEAIKKKELLPFSLQGQVIYYVGPSPTPPGKNFGSGGPTSSYRMDPYTPALLEQGVKILIGKGPRSTEVKWALQKNQAIYLASIGGAAALLGQVVKKAEIIAYPELGPEAVYKLTVADFPLVCINDLNGSDFYQLARGH